MAGREISVGRISVIFSLQTHSLHPCEGEDNPVQVHRLQLFYTGVEIAPQGNHLKIAPEV